MLTKQRFLEILYTALMGAFIAFLQSFIVGISDAALPTADPAVAGAVAGALRAAWVAGIKA